MPTNNSPTKQPTNHKSAGEESGHTGNVGYSCTELTRLERLEYSLSEVSRDVSDLTITIGRAPTGDGKPGTGMAGSLARLENLMWKLSVEKENADLRAKLSAAKASLAVEARNDERDIRDRTERRKLYSYILGAALGGGSLVGIVQTILSAIQ